MPMEEVWVTLLVRREANGSSIKDKVSGGNAIDDRHQGKARGG